MRILDGEQYLVRILVGESDRWQDTSLVHALIERLHHEGFAGVTAIHGMAGFGARSVVHTAQILELSTDLPVVIEVVEDAEHVDKLTTILDEMMSGGMVTVEKVRVLRYAPDAEPPTPAD